MSNQGTSFPTNYMTTWSCDRYKLKLWRQHRLYNCTPATHWQLQYM